LESLAAQQSGQAEGIIIVVSVLAGLLVGGLTAYRLYRVMRRRMFR